MISKKYLKNLVTRTLLSIIILLVSLIYINKSDKNLLLYKDYVFNKNISFGKINKYYTKYLGNVLPGKENEAKTVFDNEFTYVNSEEYHNGTKLSLASDTTIKSITSGIVVFIGNKENFNNTVIIQGVDGYDIWYGNLSNTDIKLYDYVKADSILGESTNKEVYYLISKDGNYVSYEEYTKEIQS